MVCGGEKGEEEGARQQGVGEEKTAGSNKCRVRCGAGGGTTGSGLGVTVVRVSIRTL